MTQTSYVALDELDLVKIHRNRGLAACLPLFQLRFSSMTTLAPADFLELEPQPFFMTSVMIVMFTF
ncbi:MAG: hypothetical protein WCA39_07375 [Nitrososphaeraceae archaeon]